MSCRNCADKKRKLTLKVELTKYANTLTDLHIKELMLKEIKEGDLVFLENMSRVTKGGDKNE